MKRLFTLLVSLLVTNILVTNAQNKVPNPSFDVQDSCPAVSEIFVCQPWKTATLGTPDAFNTTCPTQNITGRTGIGSAGVYLRNTFADNREYMQATLTSALTAGQTYYVSFWVKRSNYRYAVNRIGAYFCTGSLNLTSTSVLPYTPQVENPSTYMLSASGWMNISGSFVAAGGENNIVIGNFSNDALTDTAVINASSSSKVAYYQVDDVAVTTTGSGVNETYANESLISVFPNPSTGIFLLKADILQHPEVKIYNSTGEMLYSSRMQTEEMNMDLSTSPKGMYFIYLSSEEGIAAKKIIIQ